MYGAFIFLIILTLQTDGFTLNDVHCNVSCTTYLFILKINDIIYNNYSKFAIYLQI